MKTLLIDDHQMFTEGVSMMLSAVKPEMACVCVSTIAEAMEMEGPFDLVLLDYNLPDSAKGEGLSRVLNRFEPAPVVMVSAETRPPVIRQLIDQGASGFISKGSDGATLMKALEIILAGGVYIPADILYSVHVDEATSSEMLSLTKRQMECLLKALQGKSNKIIAREMDIAESTAKAHLQVGFRALGVNSRSEAVYRASKLGLLPGQGVDEP